MTHDAHAGQDANALTGFLNEFKSFQMELKTRMNE